jgi:diguanylate cyclase (GGDEF)-like protein
LTQECGDTTLSSAEQRRSIAHVVVRERERPPAAARPVQVSVLALVAVVSGVLSLLAARFPLAADSPVGLDVGIGVYALIAAVVLWTLGRRAPTALVHVVLLSAVVLISVVISVSATQYGALATSFAYVWMGLYASYFFSPRIANGYLLLIALGFCGGLAANSLPIRPTMWMVVIGTVLGSSSMLAFLLGRLRQLADTDQLTGLLNRRGLRLAAEPMLAMAARSGQPMSVVAIDLDGFKAVNDSAGHHAGDQLLIDLTDAWRTQLRRGDVLGRNGGDEFVLVVPGTDDEARVLLQRLREAHPADWSAGLATQGQGDDFDDLLRTADRNLYREKARRVADAKLLAGS